MDNPEYDPSIVFPRVVSGYMTEILPNSLLILHPTMPRWIETNRSGTEILALADGRRSLNEIIAAFAQLYDLSFEQSRTDVLAFLNNLGRTDFLDNNKGSVAQSPVSASPARYHLFLHLNRTCNLSCPHCYTSSQPDREIRVPATQDIIRILDDCADNGAVVLTISGGEPLIHPGFEQILRHAATHYKTSLLTNGTLINKHNLPLLTECCQGIQISLDGSNPRRHDAIRGSGTFERTMSAIKMLQDAGYNDRLVICATVMRHNLDDIVPLIEQVIHLGIPLVRFLPLMVQGRAENVHDPLFPSDEELIALYNDILPFMIGQDRTTTVSGYMSGLLLKPVPGPAEDQWCPIGRNIVMDFDGSVCPCILMLDLHWKIGNLFKESLSAILDKKGIQKMGETIRSRRNRIAQCQSCPWKNFCQAGCAGIALQQKGSLHQVDRFCAFRRDIYPRLFAQALRQRRELIRERADRRGFDPPFHGKGPCS
ncbi:PqqD family peptide modification chaperone [bacterium]|nr:PqqD family peptide modification chaperone [bacterium]